MYRNISDSVPRGHSHNTMHTVMHICMNGWICKCTYSYAYTNVCMMDKILLHCPCCPPPLQLPGGWRPPPHGRYEQPNATEYRHSKNQRNSYYSHTTVNNNKKNYFGATIPYNSHVDDTGHWTESIQIWNSIESLLIFTLLLHPSNSFNISLRSLSFALSITVFLS